jgi:hypothetical protein
MFNLNKVPGWFWAVLAALVVIMVFNRVSEGMENEDGDMGEQDEEIYSDEEAEDEALDDAEDSDEEEDEEDGLDDEEIDSME